MNLVLNFVHENWSRLKLERFGDPTRISYLLLTPRFRASSHLIFFVLAERHSKPFLVVKVPRLPGDNCRLDQEVANLNQLHGYRKGGFDSIPRVLAYEDFRTHRFLVENALQYEIMRPAIVRSHTRNCIEAVIKWLTDLHAITINPQPTVDWFANLIERPIDEFAAMFPVSEAEKHLLFETRKIAETLRDAAMPVVFEHGDLSSPNIFLGHENKIGVVDWELAEPEGLPAVDLFFFLTYIAFALKRARKHNEYINAFHDAFFQTNTWTQSHIKGYFESFHIAPEFAKPLFVLCWSRYIISLLRRLNSFNKSGGKISRENAEWLRSNRYYALWNYTIENINQLNI